MLLTRAEALHTQSASSVNNSVVNLPLEIQSSVSVNLQPQKAEPEGSSEPSAGTSSPKPALPLRTYDSHASESKLTFASLASFSPSKGSPVSCNSFCEQKSICIPPPAVNGDSDKQMSNFMRLARKCNAFYFSGKHKL